MPTFTHDSPGTAAAAWREERERHDVRPLSLGGYELVVVVAAHPDDESLGAGGLIAHLAERGPAPALVLATAGEHSHPDSPTHTPSDLAARRLREAETAVATLSPETWTVFVGLEDGHVAAGEDAVAAAVVDLVGEDGSSALVVAPWRRDGHPDHEAAGRAAAAAAHRTGATLVEYPIWWWHWSSPAGMPWPLLRRLPLEASARERKARAVAAHESQVRPLSDAPGDGVLLTADMLEHFAGAEELFVADDPSDDRLERLHREDPDPWGVDRRWYERRKRDLVLAMLPRLRYASAVDVGCSTGALSEDLTARADHVTALDASPAAVAAARRRLGALVADGRARVEVAEVPGAWPEGRFDLAVVSEVGYFLGPRDLDGLVARLRTSLAQDGTLVLCHWRHPVRGWPLDGPRVHELVRERWPHPVQGRYVDRDVEILVLAPEAAWPEPSA